MEAEDYNCSFCRMAYSDPTDIVVDPGSGSAICVECFHIGAEEFSGKRADAKLPPKAPCLICLQRIEAEGSDPCHVRVTSDDGRKASTWYAHSACIKAALHPDAQRTFGRAKSCDRSLTRSQIVLWGRSRNACGRAVAIVEGFFATALALSEEDAGRLIRLVRITLASREGAGNAHHS
jgi:hypothetical protein